MTEGFQPYTKAERLLNLLMALRSTRSGLSREQIRAVVRGYGEEASQQAFERMFERDKDQLRSMGIPVVTLTDASGTVTGYRIGADWNLAPLDVDRSELAVLGLAAGAWRLADLAPVALNALRKVEAQLGMESAQTGGAPVAGLTADSPQLLALMDACTTRTPVTFEYRRGTSVEAQRRNVQPWGVVWWRAHWYLVGWDADRGAVRVFRASRMAGEARATGEPGAYQVPEDFDPTTAIGRFPAEGGTSLALALTAGAGAAFRRVGRDLGPDETGADQVEIFVDDLRSGVARALAHGSTIRVRGPSAAVEE
ncbi:MAG: WYL domain-containing protein, partial [Candidatus Nanopelagicales bacterium]